MLRVGLVGAPKLLYNSVYLAFLSISYSFLLASTNLGAV